MNDEWSEMNKELQIQLKSEETFFEGKKTLLLLRKKLMMQIDDFYKTLTKEQFCAIPYMNARGYHSKTIAYSLYHIFRIEDIVVHTLIQNNEEIFFAGDYQRKMNASIITTGNELMKQEIALFSEKLCIKELYNYIHEVDDSTQQFINKLSFKDLKVRFKEEDKQRIDSLHVVDEDENAIWLINFWCSKNIYGLLKMPLSRHWIMHIEAALRIEKRIR